VNGPGRCTFPSRLPLPSRRTRCDYGTLTVFVLSALFYGPPLQRRRLKLCRCVWRPRTLRGLACSMKGLYKWIYARTMERPVDERRRSEHGVQACTGCLALSVHCEKDHAIRPGAGKFTKGAGGFPHVCAAAVNGNQRKVRRVLCCSDLDEASKMRCRLVVAQVVAKDAKHGRKVVLGRASRWTTRSGTRARPQT